MPVRIYDLAKKLGIESKDVLLKAKELGITTARVPSSSLDKITAEYLEGHFVSLKPVAPPQPPPGPKTGDKVGFIQLPVKPTFRTVDRGGSVKAPPRPPQVFKTDAPRRGDIRTVRGPGYAAVAPAQPPGKPVTTLR